MESAGSTLFGGNPLAEEETYLPQRNAFNNLSGDTLKSLYFTQIRTAGSSLLQIRNPETGEIYVADELGPVSPAYYFPNQGVWVNQRWGVDVAWTGTDSRGKPPPRWNAGGNLSHYGSGILPKPGRNL